MSVFVWLIFGGLCGWIAASMTGKKRIYDLLIHVSVGVFGALISSLLIIAINQSSEIVLNVQNLLIVIFGAVLFLIIFQTIKKSC